MSDGAVLRDREGYRFMARYAPDKMELARRDIVSQAIFREVQSGRGVDGGAYLDLTPIPYELLAFRFPDLISIFRKRGIDLHKQWIRVAPAAHFFMSGIAIDKRCQTNVSNLFAAGESAGGVHGAKRLSGNGLSDPLVFGRIAGMEAARHAQRLKSDISIEFPDVESMFGSQAAPAGQIAEIRREIRKILWKKAGILRNRSGLEEAVEKLERMQEYMNAGQPASRKDLRTRFMLVASLAIISY
jgi:fumarate reductase (CoM/CoB) subunit A